MASYKYFGQKNAYFPTVEEECSFKPPYLQISIFERRPFTEFITGKVYPLRLLRFCKALSDTDVVD